MSQASVLRRQPRQSRGQRRIEAILDAAEQLFAEIGYDATTTNAIAARADTAIGSLYQFFPNKEAILRELVARFLVELRASLDASLADVDSLPDLMPERAIDLVIDPLIAFYTSRTGVLRVYLEHGHGSDEGAPDVLSEEVSSRLQALLALREPTLPPNSRGSTPRSSCRPCGRCSPSPSRHMGRHDRSWWASSSGSCGPICAALAPVRALLCRPIHDYDDQWLRASAARVLSQFGKLDTEAVALLVRPAESRDDAWLRVVAAEALRALGPHAPMRALVALLQDPAFQVRYVGARALSERHETAPIGPLLAALDDSEMLIRWGSGEAPARMGARVPASELRDRLAMCHGRPAEGLLYALGALGPGTAG